MTPKSFLIPEDIADYADAHSTPPDEVLRDLVAETQETWPGSTLQIAPLQGALMSVLVRALGVHRAIEIGTFTGYSSLAIARSLAEGGTLLCLDVSDEYTSVARKYWERAGVADRVELTIGDAVESLRALPAEPTFDFAFVDAEKAQYQAYLEELHPRMHTDGLVLVDNTLWRGRVLPGRQESDADRAIAAFNDAVAADPRWESAMAPLSDGLTFLTKR